MRVKQFPARIHRSIIRCESPSGLLIIYLSWSANMYLRMKLPMLLTKNGVMSDWAPVLLFLIHIDSALTYCVVFWKIESLSTLSTSSVLLPAQLTSNVPNAFDFKILVAPVLAGSIIGKGGVIINQVSSQSGAKLQFSDNDEVFPGTSLKVLICMEIFEFQHRISYQHRISRFLLYNIYSSWL